MGLWFSGAPKCLTGSGSGFKASQKTGPLLKVSSDRLGELGIEFRTPGYKVSDLSTTPQRLRVSSITFIPMSMRYFDFKMVCMCKNGYSPLLYIRVIPLEQNSKVPSIMIIL